MKPNSPRVRTRHRALAKLVDFAPALALIILASKYFGRFAMLPITVALAYVLFADALFAGKSLGKVIVGIRVVSNKTGVHCTPLMSLKRNFLFAIAISFALIPFWGWVIFFTLGTLIIVVETFLIYHNDDGMRVGDDIADTSVKWVGHP